MDITTLVGLIFGILVVVLAIMSGSDLGIFLNLPGFLIVFGGTFAATLIRFPLHNVFIAFKLGLKAAVPSHYACFAKRTYDPADWAALFPADGPRPLIIPWNSHIIYP